MDVLKVVPVTKVLDPAYVHGTALQRNYLQLLKETGGETSRARAGQVHDLGSGARLEILAPEEPLIKGTQADANNNSIVARLVYGKTAFLFTGDMEVAERARLLKSARPEALRSNVLKVAHHGSHNGTDPEFLRLVAPEYSVISLARGNDYGHPHREAMEQLRAHGAPILRTDERGTIVFTSDGERVQLQGTPPASVPTGPRAAVTGKLIGNRTSKVYHAASCAALPAPDKRVDLPNDDEARRQGYRPHAACLGRKDNR
jgi:competence protein ComEC